MISAEQAALQALAEDLRRARDTYFERSRRGRTDLLDLEEVLENREPLDIALRVLARVSKVIERMASTSGEASKVDQETLYTMDQATRPASDDEAKSRALEIIKAHTPRYLKTLSEDRKPGVGLDAQGRRVGEASAKVLQSLVYQLDQHVHASFAGLYGHEQAMHELLSRHHPSDKGGRQPKNGIGKYDLLKELNHLASLPPPFPDAPESTWPTPDPPLGCMNGEETSVLHALQVAARRGSDKRAKRRGPK